MKKVVLKFGIFRFVAVTAMFGVFFSLGSCTNATATNVSRNDSAKVPFIVKVESVSHLTRVSFTTDSNQSASIVIPYEQGKKFPSSDSVCLMIDSVEKRKIDSVLTKSK